MKKAVIFALVCILMISLFLLGKWVGAAENSITTETTATETAATEYEPAQNLHLSFVHNIDSMGYLPLDQGNYTDVSYRAIEDVSIKIDGESIALEDALTNGKITVDEIITWARQDAALGFCTEVAKSKNGLTELFYHYGDFSLRYMYDVFETPDAGQHLVTNFDIYSNGAPSYSFLPIDEETGQRLDYENWGLDFAVLKADRDSITVKCSQSGGQQIGTFTVEDILLYKTDPDTQDFKVLEPLTEEASSIEGSTLTMEGETELVLDFTQLYGQLDAGAYVLSLDILDQYSQEDVHPLMRNYHDAQWYEITFTIE